MTAEDILTASHAPAYILDRVLGISHMWYVLPVIFLINRVLSSAFEVWLKHLTDAYTACYPLPGNATPLHGRIDLLPSGVRRPSLVN